MTSLTATAVLRISVLALSQSNELFSCFNPWIITTSATSNELGYWFLLDPIVLTLLFAILEPPTTRDILRLEVPPWTILLGVAPLHLAWSLTSMDVYKALRNQFQQSIGTEGQKFAGILPTGSRSGSTSQTAIQRIYIAITFVLPVITSTVLNATLLLLSHSLNAPSIIESTWILLQAGAAVLFFLSSRYADYVIYKTIGRKSAIGTAVICQIILISIRAYTRTFVDVKPLAPFQIPDSREAEQMFRSDRYVWKWDPLSQSEVFAAWWWMLTLTGGFMMLASRYLMLGGIIEQAR